MYFGCRRNADLVCYRSMIGYFYQLKVWDSLALRSNQLQLEFTSNCGSSSCTFCPAVGPLGTSGTCIQAQPQLIFELDLEQDTQILLSQRTAPVEYQFKLGASTGISTFDDPIRVKLQGLKFGKNKYIQSLNTPLIRIPQIFTFEAWIRFDTENPGSFGDL